MINKLYSERVDLAILKANQHPESAADKKAKLMETVKQLLDIEEELRNKPQADSRMMHITLLRNASDLLRDQHEQEAALPVARAWINDFSMILCISNLPHQFKDDIDIFVEIVVKYNLVNEISADVDASRVLAFACTTLVLCHAQSASFPSTANVGRLMSQWAGKAAPKKAATDLASHVDFLYGPGVWDLYCTELVKTEHIPRHLYVSAVLPRLPYTPMSQQANSNESVLPTTLA